MNEKAESALTCKVKGCERPRFYDRRCQQHTLLMPTVAPRMGATRRRLVQCEFNDGTR